MSLTSAPLFSESASGSLSNLLSYVTTRGKTHARINPRRRDPDSPKQHARRALLKFIGETWRNQPAYWRSVWLSAMTEPDPSPYHAWIADASRFVNSNRGPRAQPNIQGVLVPAAFLTATATRQGRQLTFTWTRFPLYTGWAIWLHETTLTGSALLNNTLAIRADLFNQIVIDRVPQGTHHYRLRANNVDGAFGPTSPVITTTIP